MPAPPRVSVLLTTHNGAAFLRPTLDSVLAQSFQDFELVVVDDASTDATPQLLAACADPRLRILRSDRRLGVAEARNVGFAACRGTFIAAQDHDDLSRPDRLAVQLRYLERHPDIVLAGGEVLIEVAGRLDPTDHLPGATPALLRWMLHVDNPLTWSTVMVRADAARRLGRFMRPEFEPADDFDLYHRLLAQGGIARLDDTLGVYRWHAANASHALMGRIHDRAAAVLARAYAPWLGSAAPEAAGLVVRHLSDRQPVPDAPTLARLGDVLQAVLAGFCAATSPDPDARARIEAHAARSWWLAARAAIRSGVPGALRGWREATSLRRNFRPGVAELAKSLAVGGVRRHLGKIRPGLRPGPARPRSAPSARRGGAPSTPRLNPQMGPPFSPTSGQTRQPNQSQPGSTPQPQR